MRYLCLILTLLSSSVEACLCSKPDALEKGVIAIVNQFPAQSSNINDYQIVLLDRTYIITLKVITKDKFDLRHPEAKVHAENCEMLNVHLPQ